MARTINWQRTGGETHRVTVTEYVAVDMLHALYDSRYITYREPLKRAPSKGSINGYPLPSFGWVST